MDKRNLRRRAIRSAAASDSSDEEKDNRPVTRSKDSKKTPSPKKRGYKGTHQSPAEKNSDLEIYETHSEEEDEVDSSQGDRSGSPSANDSLHGTPEPSPENTVKHKHSTRPRDQVDNRQPSADSQKSGNGSKCCIIMLIVVVVVIYFFGVQFFSTDSQTILQHKMDNISVFKTKVEEMKKIFPSQMDKFWKTISSSMKHLLSQPEPAYPAVILLWVPKGFSVTASKLVNYLGKSINNVYNIHSSDFIIDASDLDKSAPGKEKLNLDQNLQKVLSHNRVVVVNHLEEISPTAVLLLHAYCDGDNAPYKNVSIVLVFHSSHADTDLSSRDVDRQLQQIWTGKMDNDEIPALISRVANNVAIIKNEQHAN